VKRRQGEFTLWEHGKISILCGDFFSLVKSDLGVIDTVYDRAALTALPEDIRGLYVAHLRQITPETVKMFLLTAEDADEITTQGQVFGVDEEIEALYSAAFKIDLAHVESVLELDPVSPEQAPERTEYKVYRLSALSGAA